MQTNSDAEFRMMFLLNNMDINQEGQLSSEDRLFSSGTPRYQSSQSQVSGEVRGYTCHLSVNNELNSSVKP